MTARPVPCTLIEACANLAEHERSCGDTHRVEGLLSAHLNEFAEQLINPNRPPARGDNQSPNLDRRPRVKVD